MVLFAYKVTYNYTYQSGLLRDLWDVSFTAQHIKGGFKDSGPFPLSHSAINHPESLHLWHPSQPQAALTTSQAASAIPQSQSHGDKEIHVAGTTLQLACCK